MSRVPESVAVLVANKSKENPASSSPQQFKLQRMFSQAIDDARLEALKSEPEFTQDHVIRSKSCGHRGASLYLVGPVSYDDQLSSYFMDAPVFSAAVRLRLGLEVRPLADACEGCGEGHATDTLGHASLKCMHCGKRTKAHNALRDVLAGICRDALLTPKIEPHAFAKQPNLRADLAFFGSGTLYVIDVAITHPFQASAFVRQLAATTAGGAATVYESVKVAHYKSALTPSLTLVPFVCDTYGALSESAINLIQAIVPLYARRLGISSQVASRIVFGRITTCVVKSMAMIATSL